MSTPEEKERMRSFICERIRRVPPSVNNGSIQDVHNFRNFLERARRVLDRPRSTEAEIMGVYKQTIEYYK